MKKLAIFSLIGLIVSGFSIDSFAARSDGGSGSGSESGIFHPAGDKPDQNPKDREAIKELMSSDSGSGNKKQVSGDSGSGNSVRARAAAPQQKVKATPAPTLASEQPLENPGKDRDANGNKIKSRAAAQQVVGAPKMPMPNAYNNAMPDADNNSAPSCLTKEGCLIVVKIVNNNIEYGFIDVNPEDGSVNNE